MIERARTIFQKTVPFLGLLIFALALVILQRELAGMSWRDVRDGIAATPGWSLASAALLTLASFVVLAGYDRLALHYAREPLARLRSSLASSLGFALSNALGMPLLTSAPVRYRLYSAWGLAADQVLRVVAFGTFTFWVGLLAMAGVLFIAAPATLPDDTALPFATLRPLGVALLLLIAGYLAWTRLAERPLRVAGVEFRVPDLPLALRQLSLGGLDWIVSGLVLFVLLPPGHELGFLPFLAAFVAAHLAGQLSRVPGGLGVVEAVLVSLLAPAVELGPLLASLLVWRGVYYLAPLFLGVATLGAWELRERRAGVRRTVGAARRAALLVTPLALAAGTFVAGVLLLAWGSLPTPPGHLAWVDRFLPHAAFELSHFLASLVGAGLLILSWGLMQRLDTAYNLTLILLVVGIALSLIRGFELLPAASLALLFLALLPARREFFREGSLTLERFSPGWVALVTGVVLATAWLAVVAFTEVELVQTPWWSLPMADEAPRAFRALAGASTLLLLFAGVRLLRPVVPPELIRPAGGIPAEVEAAARSADRASALLALTGDKSFLLSPSGQSFIMYGVEGRSWVSLGDPVGDRAEEPELVWRFRKLAFRYGGWPVFYQARPDRLGLYLDAGLALLKLGEEARLPLADLTLEGGRWRDFRQTLNRAEREGVEFRYLEGDEVEDILPRLREVSDAWLASRSVREKGFSVGTFHESYLRRTPVGVALRDGRVEGFVNVLAPDARHELSADLMRYRPDAMKGVMEFLFMRLLLEGKERGYRTFSLGMAPLSGLDARPLAPLWNRMGAAIFRHGEHFYNFQGLRAYKERFNPEWEPRYLACPGGLALPRILANVGGLIGGGLSGLVRR
jgi:phosphatidylglycerol lysyltransferase